MKKKNHIESKLLTGSVLICKMIKAGWTNNKMLLVLWMQDGKSLQSGQFSPSDLQRGLSVSRSKLGPRVRRERAHLRLPLPGWMPDVPRLWKGHGKRGLWTESVIRNNSACLLSHLFKECERQCVVFPMPWTLVFPALSEGCAQPVCLQLKGYIEFSDLLWNFLPCLSLRMQTWLVLSKYCEVLLHVKGWETDFSSLPSCVQFTSQASVFYPFLSD